MTNSNHGITWFLKVLLLFMQFLQYVAAQSTESPPPPDQFAFNPKFNSSLAVIMIILVSVFFILGFCTVYIRQCTERRRNREGLLFSTIGSDGRPRNLRGLDAEVIAMFPTFKYSSVKGLKIGKGSLECAVCLNEFEDDETLRLIPNCNHVFHPDCIDAWLSSHTTCPVCRANLVPKPGEAPYATLHIFDPDSESEEQTRRPETNETTQIDDSIRLRSEFQLSPNRTTNQNRPPRSWSTGFRLTGLFPRSHSTGHSQIQAGENRERFTLRLPEDVRSQILNSNLNRTKSYEAFPRVRSARSGFRSKSVGFGRVNDRFESENRSGQWGFTVTPPFFTRTGSVRSPNVSGAGELTATPKSLFRSVKSPFDRLFLGTDKDSNNSNDNVNVGERSFDRLKSKSDGQV